MKKNKAQTSELDLLKREIEELKRRIEALEARPIGLLDTTDLELQYRLPPVGPISSEPIWWNPPTCTSAPLPNQPDIVSEFKAES